MRFGLEGDHVVLKDGEDVGLDVRVPTDLFHVARFSEVSVYVD